MATLKLDVPLFDWRWTSSYENAQVQKHGGFTKPKRVVTKA